MTKTIGETSADSRFLAERLAKVEPKGEVTYDELSEVIGRNVQNGARSSLATARKIACRDHKIVFGVDRGKGFGVSMMLKKFTPRNRDDKEFDGRQNAD